MEQIRDYKNLIELREKFFAGKAALEENELEFLLEQFNKLIRLLVEFEITSDLEKYIDIISEVIEASFPGNTSKDLAAAVEIKNFKKFGEFLISLTTGNLVVEKHVLHRAIAAYLDLLRRSEVLTRLDDTKAWASVTSNLIKTGEFTFLKLYKQRLADYSNKTLFNVIRGNSVHKYNWNDVDHKVRKYSAGIAGNLENEESKVAFLMENSLDMAILDIACLTSGIVNIMIPANSVPQHIEFILNQTKADIIIISDEKQLSKLKTIKKNLLYLRKVVMLIGSSIEEWVIPFKEFLKNTENSKERLKQLEQYRTPKSLATIMYTSGTTGEPKGIMFTDINIVYKRFCRAMALPEINDQDRYLAYLPLFHTFGRYLELTGAIFWGAEYSFMENPSAETMIENMRLIKPTIFISIPKKWLQLYESISRKVDIELDDKNKVYEAVNSVTGGHLKWGLSAAGYLPSEIFMFFQNNNIELMSGFGMTEATGGITMTPPKKYRENSLGYELPGVEIKVADDGELLIRGDYVMSGYYGVKKSETFLDDDWFPTGDIMRMDNDGFIEIIDRKKEIYKNIKGETIAPQRIENFFRDSEFVKQVFLVGDHRPFNTVLIYPDQEDSIFDKMNSQQVQDYYSSVVVTVNKFLAPFERIIDFRLIDRSFSAELGELTPKGTYKRRVIEENFSAIIEEMYTKNYTQLRVNDIEIRIPNWFLREKGSLSRDIIGTEEGIAIPKLDLDLVIHKTKSHHTYRIGDYNYKIKSHYIDFQPFLTNPNYWLGNNGLFKFTGESIIRWSRHFDTDSGISFVSREPHWHDIDIELYELQKIMNAGEKSFYGLHRALLLLQAIEEEKSLFAVKYLEFLMNDDTLPIYKYAFTVFYKPHLTEFISVKRLLFRTILRFINVKKFEQFLELYIHQNYDLLNEELIEMVCEYCRDKKYLKSIVIILENEVERVCLENDSEFSPIPYLFNLLSRYGQEHPTTYEYIRRVFVKFQLEKDRKELMQMSQNARTNMRLGFRGFLGANQKIAVDEETGEEYRWKDVVVFEEGINHDDKERILKTIIEKPVIREAIFLSSKGKLVRLDNIVPRGIWISHLRDYDFKSVYRLSIQTNRIGAFDLTLSLVKNIDEESVIEEVNWLIRAGSRHFVHEFVEDFCGYWPEGNLWTATFIPGDSAWKFMSRKSKKNEEANLLRLKYLWPFFVWNAAASYFNFWRLTNYKLALGNVSPKNFIIPLHDYQTGTRLISLSDRQDCDSLISLFENFHSKFVAVMESEFPFIKNEKHWNYIFSGQINANGEVEGIKVLERFKAELEDSDINRHKEILVKLDKFLSGIKKDGYIPKQLYFAIKRYHRWLKLNEDADLSAKAEMLKELTDSYQLAELSKSYSETRARFFFETVFRYSSDELKSVLKKVILMQHDHTIEKEEVLRKFIEIQAEYELSEEEDYFLTRLSYPHLRPTDEAVVLKIESDGAPTSNLVVQFDDYDGNPFLIRKPITPKEISKLHKLFIDANLLVSFRPEHQFLVAISERGYIIGGLFYMQTADDTVYMDKIVVSNRYRRKGISELLMNELFNRLSNDNYKFVTTGFFRPEYFYHFGFKIEKKHSGLVKELDQKTE